MKLYLIKVNYGEYATLADGIYGVYTDLNKCVEDKNKLEQKYQDCINDGDWQIYIQTIESDKLNEETL